MRFGERLRELREDSYITQKTLASELRVSPRMISFYESGAHFPRDESILIRLADYFGVSTDYLLGYSDVQQAGHLHKLNAAFEALPESDRGCLLEFLDFLLAKQRHAKS